METEIANKICKLGQFKDSSMYRAECCCTSDDHSQTLDIEYDKDCNDINICVYVECFTPYLCVYHGKDNSWWEEIVYWFNIQKTKAMWIWNILTKGYIKVQSTFTLNGEDQVRDYIKALNKGYDHVKSWKYVPPNKTTE